MVSTGEYRREVLEDAAGAVAPVGIPPAARAARPAPAQRTGHRGALGRDAGGEREQGDSEEQLTSHGRRGRHRHVIGSAVLSTNVIGTCLV